MRQAALALLTVLVLAACGGGGGGSSRLSKSEFDAKANAVCDKYEKKIKAVPQPSGTKDIVSYIDKVLPILDEGTGKLDELNPPKEIESTVCLTMKSSGQSSAHCRMGEEPMKA